MNYKDIWVVLVIRIMGIDFVDEPDEWMDEWMHQVNENTDYHETGEGWGVDFNGNYIFRVNPGDSPMEEPITNFAEVSDGAVHSVENVDPDEIEEYDYGFIYEGSYDSWKQLIHGEIGPIDGLMSGAFDVVGDMQLMLQYTDGASTLASAANQVDTEFPY